MITVSANLSPENFLKTAGPWLESREAQNNLILGIASQLVAKPPDQRQAHHFWVVKEGKKIAGAAFWTPPFKLSLTEMGPGALLALARKVGKSHADIPGVSGPQEVLPAFIRAWNRPGLQAELESSFRLYRLERVRPVPPVGGLLRPAEESEIELLVQWFRQFREETQAAEKLDEREWIEGYLREDRLFTWNHGQACAMAGFAGATAAGARIVMVYTPRSLRKRGYASNLVSALSQRLLDKGKKFCVLYANHLNSASNSIYQKMGYQAAGDWDSYVFRAFEGLESGPEEKPWA